MCSERSWPRRLHTIMALGAAATVAACDRPQPTEVRNGTPAIAARAPGNAANQSYDIVVESVVEGLPPQRHEFHVERRRTGTGWKTHIDKTLKWPGAGAGKNDNQLASIDIDEEGNQTARDANGRLLATDPSPKFKATLAGASSKYSSALKGLTASRPVNAVASDRPTGRHDFDLVDDIVKSKDESKARLGKMRAQFGPPHVDALGREHYSRSEKGATVDVVADPERAVVTDLTRREPGRAPERVHYEYVDVGDKSVRRQVKYTRPKTERDPGSSLTITFSRIAVDGKEIKP